MAQSAAFTHISRAALYGTAGSTIRRCLRGFRIDIALVLAGVPLVNPRYIQNIQNKQYRALALPVEDVAAERYSPVKVHLAIGNPQTKAVIDAVLRAQECFSIVSGGIGYQAGADVRILGWPGDCGNGIAGNEGFGKVLCVGGDETDADLVDAFVAGAWGFVPGTVSGEQLALVVEQLAAGECPILALISRRPAAAALLAGKVKNGEARSRPAAPRSRNPLSARETQILAGIARGQSNRAIAKRLGLGEQTVKNHVSGILNKTGAHNRAEAAAEATRHGWLTG